MKRSVIALLSLALAGIVQVAAAQGAPGKIGVVNFQGLVQNSPQFQAALGVLDGEFAGDLREIQSAEQNLRSREEKLTKEAATMTELQRAAAERELREGYIDLQAKQNKVEDRLNARRDEEFAKVQRAVVEEVQKYAVANGYSMILADGVLFAEKAMDITAPILQALQSKTAAPAAPAATTPARP